VNLPFTPDQFLAVFERYNNAVWPVQIVLNLLALAAIVLAIRRKAYSSKTITGILAFLWCWIGIAYHLAFFADINPAAKVFGALNFLQGLLFLYFGIVRPKLSFGSPRTLIGAVGALCLLYALLVYPLLGYAFGHIFPRTPTFGLPCPTTIFTFGMLLWTDAPVPKLALAIPFLWSLVGFSAAVSLGIREDTGLLVAGLLGVVLLWIRDRRSPRPIE
jgi:hypothetical protein